jgi:hypothetical protein
MDNIASGYLIFRGHDDKEMLSESIAWPLVKKILNQIVDNCNELPEDQCYSIKWEIIKGNLT